jgi:hypothetical protein
LKTPVPHTLTIEIDPATKTLSVGKWSTQDIHYNSTPNENYRYLKASILNANGIELDVDPSRIKCADDIKRFNAQVAQHLGGRFNAQLRAVSNRLWITPIEHYLNIYCLYHSFARPYFHLEQTKRVWACLPIVKQVYDDELHHIGPLVIFFMLPPCELKKRFGKSLWKRLCQNKLYFNKSLAGLLMQLNQDYERLTPLDDKTFDKLIPLINVLTKVKKCFSYQHANEWNIDTRELDIKGFNGDIIDLKTKLLTWLNHHCKASNKEDIRRHVNLVRDTLFMNCELEESHLFKWRSPQKMRQQHDMLSKRLTQKRRNESLKENQKIDDKMQWLTNYIEPVNTITKKQSLPIKATILNNVYSLINESDEMEHCITCYIDGICEQQYIAFSLVTPSSRSTLGFMLNKKGTKYKFDQHVKKYNQQVTEPLLIKVEKLLLKTVNQQLTLQNKDRPTASQRVGLICAQN